MLEVTNLSGGYTQSKPVIHQLTFQVKPHQMVGLIGVNGAGKSTTIKHILGLMKPFTGSITLNGSTIEENPTQFRSQIAYIPETPSLYKELTLWEHMKLTAMAYGLDEKTLQERGKRLLQIFHMERQVDWFPDTFSKGMKQKVMILCAFLVKPSLLIVDEPFVGLDPLAIHSLLELLVEMKEEGAGILISTHILGTAEKYCDQLILLHDGKIVLQGTVETMGEQAGLPNATLDELFIHVAKG